MKKSIYYVMTSGAMLVMAILLGTFAWQQTTDASMTTTANHYVLWASISALCFFGLAILLAWEAESFHYRQLIRKLAKAVAK